MPLKPFPGDTTGGSEHLRSDISELSNTERLASSGIETPSGEPKGSADSDCVIGRGLRILGNVVADDMLRLDGVVEGDIQCTVLRVGDSGHVMGGIVADDVTVDGRVGGDIKGQRVTLQSQARVTGDIHHVQLAIEQGAQFEGRSCPSKTPTESEEPTPMGKKGSRTSNLG